MSRRRTPPVFPERMGAVLVGAAVVAALLAGCGGAGPDAAVSPEPPSASPSPTAAPSAPTCDTVVTEASVAAALRPGTTGAPVSALDPAAALDGAAIEARGGLVCSWRTGGAPQPWGADESEGDWAYLRVSVLPGAADRWVAPFAGDTPTEDRVQLGGVEAAATAGEAGWTVSAPVGDDWVEVRVTTTGLASDAGRLAGDEFDPTTERVQAVAAEAFEAVAASAPLDAPAASSSGNGACDGGLASNAAVAGLGLAPGSVTVRLVEGDPVTPGRAALADLGAFTCAYDGETSFGNEVRVIPGGGPLLTAMLARPDFPAVIDAVALEGAVDGESAYRVRRADGPQGPVYFTLGDRLLIAGSFDGATSLAEGVIAETR